MACAWNWGLWNILFVQDNVQEGIKQSAPITSSRTTLTGVRPKKWEFAGVIARVIAKFNPLIYSRIHKDFRRRFVFKLREWLRD